MYMYKNFFFDLYGTLVDIRTDEQKPSLWRNLAEYIQYTRLICPFRIFSYILFIISHQLTL